MVKCHIVLPLLPYSFNPTVGVELAESAPAGGRRQWRCACDPSVHVCVGDPSVYVSVLVTSQCMFLCLWPCSACFCARQAMALPILQLWHRAVECPGLCSCSGQFDCHCTAGNGLGVWPQWLRKTEKQTNPQVLLFERLLDIYAKVWSFTCMDILELPS